MQVQGGTDFDSAGRVADGTSNMSMTHPGEVGASQFTSLPQLAPFQTSAWERVEVDTTVARGVRSGTHHWRCTLGLGLGLPRCVLAYAAAGIKGGQK